MATDARASLKLCVVEVVLFSVTVTVVIAEVVAVCELVAEVVPVVLVLVVVGRSICTGVCLSDVVPSPNWPFEFAPVAYLVPSEATKTL